ncbi:hypothetical protein D477_014216 [Arthrobacter crystallopoietes BAB-32]|uniref:Uncharacterized protein n=1 Tax=Arthrobacter crystallopoietes BAB-32 TaxID=1246476 RepID=N1V5M4_9MICC|nr:hypothetical protein [Arthrobacter crystallopoietes]EMY33563.1 hypothetical protein D477_014216 [Arthrobacter crystallopoietes BAB-32]
MTGVIMRPNFRILSLLVLLLAFLAPASPVSAAPADSERTYATFFATNDCNGEAVTGEAIFHVVRKVQRNGDIILNIQAHGQGVGSQGNEYVFNYKRSDRIKGGDYVRHERVRVISKGSAPNFMVTIIFNTATGESTVNPDCRG